MNTFANCVSSGQNKANFKLLQQDVIFFHTFTKNNQVNLFVAKFVERTAQQLDI